MSSAKPPSPVRTLADLAALANVSASTASRALNDSPLVNAETRARIHALAAEHNFQVHLGAQSLRRQRTQTLAHSSSGSAGRAGHPLPRHAAKTMANMTPIV